MLMCSLFWHKSSDPNVSQQWHIFSNLPDTRSEQPVHWEWRRLDTIDSFSEEEDTWRRIILCRHVTTATENRPKGQKWRCTFNKDENDKLLMEFMILKEFEGLFQTAETSRWSLSNIIMFS